MHSHLGKAKQPSTGQRCVSVIITFVALSYINLQFCKLHKVCSGADSMSELMLQFWQKVMNWTIADDDVYKSLDQG